MKFSMKPDLHCIHPLLRHDRKDAIVAPLSHHQLQSRKAARYEVSHSIPWAKHKDSRVDGGEWDGLCDEMLLQEVADVRRASGSMHRHWCMPTSHGA